MYLPVRASHTSNIYPYFHSRTAATTLDATRSMTPSFQGLSDLRTVDRDQGPTSLQHVCCTRLPQTLYVCLTRQKLSGAMKVWCAAPRWSHMPCTICGQVHCDIREPHLRLNFACIAPLEAPCYDVLHLSYNQQTRYVPLFIFGMQPFKADSLLQSWHAGAADSNVS